MFMIAIAVGLLASDPATIQTVTKKVTIEGARYRVRVRGDEVEVASKSLVAIQTLNSRDRMRRAVAEATRCRLVDELQLSASILQGRLDCGVQ